MLGGNDRPTNSLIQHSNILFDICSNSFDLWDSRRIKTVKQWECAVRKFTQNCPKLLNIYSHYIHFMHILVFFFIFASWGGNSRRGSCCTSENSAEELVGKHVLNVIVSPVKLPQSWQETEGGHGREWRQTFEKRTFFFREKKNSLQLDVFSCEA